jgi:peptidoglycan lytic transglycosylase
MKPSLLLSAILLAGCAAAPPAPEQASQVPEQSPVVAQPPSKGGYYKDDGPGETPPPDLAAIADPEPKLEPLHRFANRPYQVLGRHYVPVAALQPFRERGIASWYGKKFHGQRTSSGERYDMYAMSAAHPTLPIPSYARVTRISNARSVVVRINDRGPFHSNRIIDLSYAAAYKLGYIQAGSAEVEVEAIVPGEKPVEQAEAVYVQVGAFASQANAEVFRARVASELGWLKETVKVLLHGDLWRLQVGPYPSTDEARSVAARIESGLNLKPLLVIR